MLLQGWLGGTELLSKVCMGVIRSFTGRAGGDSFSPISLHENHHMTSPTKKKGVSTIRHVKSGHADVFETLCGPARIR